MLAVGDKTNTQTFSNQTHPASTAFQKWMDADLMINNYVYLPNKLLSSFKMPAQHRLR